MGEDTDNSIKKEGILLARNTPVALIVGAAGFIGSHLSETLLEKHIQVIGVDNLSTGKKEYLSEANKKNNFHFINTSAERLALEVARLDYIFIAAEGEFDLTSILDLALKHHSRIVFVSTIHLYEKDYANNLAWFKHWEEGIARFAKEHNLNARIIRLASVYGPRMHFRENEAMLDLINAALLGQLQTTSSSAQFSTRSLYIKDAVDLIIKSMFAGSTALKIFDGARFYPIQVSEIKQVLLDPVWYENKDFKPTELPPWPTPNLEKTMKLLHWQPQVALVRGLKETLNYFKESDIPISAPTPNLKSRKINLWVDEKEINSKKEKGQEIKKPSHYQEIFKKVLFLSLLVLVLYSFFYPFISLSIGIFNFRERLTLAAEALQKGDFDSTLGYIDSAADSINSAKLFLSSVAVVKEAGLFPQQFKQADSLIIASSLITEATRHTALGSKSLHQLVKITLNQGEGDIKEILLSAQTDLASADEKFSKAKAILESNSFKDLPGLLSLRVENLTDRLDYGMKLAQKTKIVSQLIPELVALDSRKSYLLVLQDDLELRPTGGLIVAGAKLNFNSGKLKTFEILDISELDQKLSLKVEPPKEIKEDLGVTAWKLKDSNFEPDFPATARQIEWFYDQAVRVKVDGVVAIDLSAAADLLRLSGPVNVAGVEVSADSLIEVASKADQKSFYIKFLEALVNKLLLPTDLNWPGVLASLDHSLSGKHLILYFNDSAALSLAALNNWTGQFPRPTAAKEGETQDLLSIVESNMGGNKANHFLTRKTRLITSLNQEGQISHELTVEYANLSPNDSYPAGQYKNRIRLYLPFGSSLDQLTWGEEDLIKQVSSFSDYGRSAFSFLITLNPNEQKTLTAKYHLPQALSFKGGAAVYSLRVVKQAGLKEDSLNWKLTYPVNYQISGQRGSSGEYSISIKVATDQLWELNFTK